MSSSDRLAPIRAHSRAGTSRGVSRRRAIAALLGGAALSACGFKPLHRKGGGAAALSGAVRLQEAFDPETYAYRERLRRRFGNAASDAPYSLTYELVMEETGVAITQASDVTRFQIAAEARYRLITLADGVVVAEGAVRSAGAYDATAEPFASLSAQRAEREEIAADLAERTVSRLLAEAEAGAL
ncbi:MAG: LPS assembly lipoprotein LptE [Pseudomonadota bacterium]